MKTSSYTLSRQIRMPYMASKVYQIRNPKFFLPLRPAHRKILNTLRNPMSGIMPYQRDENHLPQPLAWLQPKNLQRIAKMQYDWRRHYDRQVEPQIQPKPHLIPLSYWFFEEGKMPVRYEARNYHAQPNWYNIKHSGLAMPKQAIVEVGQLRERGLEATSNTPMLKI